MYFSWKTYLILFGVFLCSILTLVLFPPATFFQQIAFIPGSMSLLGILYQLSRDEAKYQKDLMLQRDQQMFDIGATSHMANVAFDKHVLFCEEYVAAMHEIVTGLYREGPSPEALIHANKLHQIQRKYTVWLTPEIEKGLEPFEYALRRIGASAQYRRDDFTSAKANGAVDKMYDLFSDVLGISENDTRKVDEQVAVTTILTQLRKVLGVEEITSLRQRLLNDNPLLVPAKK